MQRIDDLFSNSFDQLIEHLFHKPSALPGDSPGLSSDNIGNYIELYREKKHLETRQQKLKKILREKNAVIINLKEQILNHISEKSSLKQQQITTSRENHQRTQFLAKVSHDLRTPINSISGIAGLLNDGSLNPEQLELITLIDKSSRSLSALIDDLLDYSKIEAGAFKLEHLDFVLEDTIKECVDLLTFQAHEKNIDLGYSLVDGLPSVVIGDPLRLRQVLINLAGNAIKFTEQGSVHITVGMETELENELTVRFQVKDTGIGISEDQQERLFNCYSQADESTCRKYGGTGLGLAVSRELVQLMGGQIGVLSNKNRGSTFWFTARFGINKMESPNSEKTPSRQLSTPDELRKQRILLVEDDDVTRKISSLLMTQSGYENVDIAENGLSAIQKLQNKSYDLVLMDMVMPEMDGIEATRFIRDPDSGVLDAKVPIVAMTANTLEEDREKCIVAGMNGFISKPLKANDLNRAIEDLKSAGLRAKDRVLQESCSNLPVFDHEKLDQLQEDLGEKFKPLVEIFLKHLPEKLEAMQSAASSKDFESLKNTAHKLKGNCGSFYALRLVSLCNRIQQSADQNNDTCQELVWRLKSAATTMVEALRLKTREI